MAGEKNAEIQSFNREALNLEFDEISVEALEQRLEFSGILRPDLFYHHGEPGHATDPYRTSDDCESFCCGSLNQCDQNSCPPPPPPPCPSDDCSVFCPGNLGVY